MPMSPGLKQPDAKISGSHVCMEVDLGVRPGYLWSEDTVLMDVLMM